MKQYIVDAFTKEVFHGNQAAVCVLDAWPDESLMMAIARENNLSETAFTVREGDGYRLRWFTPGGEIDLCGHATLATAFVLLSFYEREAERITFHTMSGDLHVGRRGECLAMDFPAYACHEVAVTDQMEDALGARPKEAYLDRDLLLVYEDEATVRNMRPDFARVAQIDGADVGVAVTAPGTGHDCVSRFFAPNIAIDEDPVTGSVHCMIAPYWGRRLGKTTIDAYQASARGGEMVCKLRDNRVVILGDAALFSVADLML